MVMATLLEYRLEEKLDECSTRHHSCTSCSRATDCSRKNDRIAEEISVPGGYLRKRQFYAFVEFLASSQGSIVIMTLIGCSCFGAAFLATFSWMCSL